MSMPRAFPLTSLPHGSPSTAGGHWVYSCHPDQTLRDEPTENTELVDSGKWMLFYPRSEMDARWKEAIKNMHAGRFGIVRLMKASTFMDNPRSSDSSNYPLHIQDFQRPRYGKRPPHHGYYAVRGDHLFQDERTDNGRHDSNGPNEKLHTLHPPT